MNKRYLAISITLFLIAFVFFILLEIELGSLVIFEDGSWMWGDWSGCLPLAICND
jgi:hypothetical protein